MKKFTQIGNSWGVIIPKAIFELLKINPVKDNVEFEIEGNTLKIKKAEQKE